MVDPILRKLIGEEIDQVVAPAPDPVADFIRDRSLQMDKRCAGLTEDEKATIIGPTPFFGFSLEKSEGVDGSWGDAIGGGTIRKATEQIPTLAVGIPPAHPTGTFRTSARDSTFTSTYENGRLVEQTVSYRDGTNVAFSEAGVEVEVDAFDPTSQAAKLNVKRITNVLVDGTRWRHWFDGNGELVGAFAV